MMEYDNKCTEEKLPVAAAIINGNGKIFTNAPKIATAQQKTEGFLDSGKTMSAKCFVKTVKGSSNF